jgi:hypothetical protein
VAAASRDLLRDGDLATCLPYLLESGYSAAHQPVTGYDGAMHKLSTSMVLLHPSPRTTGIALDVQRRLVQGGKGRAAGVIDITAVAIAIDNATADAPITLIHYDTDYDHIWSVRDPQWARRGFAVRWIIPRGETD